MGLTFSGCWFAVVVRTANTGCWKVRLRYTVAAHSNSSYVTRLWGRWCLTCPSLRIGRTTFSYSRFNDLPLRSGRSASYIWVPFRSVNSASAQFSGMAFTRVSRGRMLMYGHHGLCGFCRSCTMKRMMERLAGTLKKPREKAASSSSPNSVIAMASTLSSSCVRGHSNSLLSFWWFVFATTRMLEWASALAGRTSSRGSSTRSSG
mmetsp:Transcript_39692/g.99962  ORF Transcript_39692/g.99962 Transcript_39692/m.99962 type:complete len:205 (-) Transcript_39692:82-696(-)